ncbi:RDD family protein [Pseudoxanthomonas indica]|uniref:Uncharacterized membrane protein YckC, RDD family n=1 Tax=Pseudoxanthomonas indica TaxID=428993 RepID=A0A1T5KDT9_9GAMM|nr:RDD family protein [Pseudoxanthomonas indica]GGD48739.1 hypothetical protein GCM10007235_20810 [Pseudoxanthomonas indica]SKC61863.1 Uncharacterized membrane protein YckC, RDD family [Pseudoxanthomonas indica]
MSTWYYASAERQQLGPVSTDELKQYFHSDRIGMETLVWRDGMLHWRPLQELAEQLGLLPAIAASEVASALPVVAPPVLSRTAIEPAAAADSGFEPIAQGPATIEGAAPSWAPASTPAPAAPAAPAQTPAPTPTPRAGHEGRAVFSLGTEPSPAPAPVYARAAVDPGTVAAAGNPYAAGYSDLHNPAPVARASEFVVNAGFWKRVAASVIDSIILAVAGGLCAELFGALISDLFSGGELAEIIMTAICAILINATYHAWFHSTLLYATPGKMAVGIKVLRSNGEPISFLRALGRFFATALSAIPLGLGYVMAAFTARKQALHDLISDTVVVDKWAYTNEPERQRTELGTVTVIVLALYGVAILLIFLAFFMLGLSGMMGRV